MATALSPDLLRTDVLAEIPEMVRLRRDLHQHPELGFQEVRTAGIVADALEAMGLKVRRNVARTGVVAVIDGGLPGPTLLMRADMDALPIHEENTHDFISKHAGKMHACGHDGHTSILLTAARILVRRKATLKGRIKLVFQPAEEGPGGAEPMIAEGVLEDPKVDAAVGLHLWSHLPVGTVGVSPGPFMAAADSFTIKIRGCGGHAAAPQQCVDPVVTAAHLILALQTISSRNVDPFKPVAVSITRVRGGEANNVIPAEVELGGTMRTFEEELRTQVRTRIVDLVDGVCKSFGAEGEFVFDEGYPPLVNDPGMTQLVRGVCEQMNLTLRDDQRTLGGEDMAYFLREVPGCYFFLGAGNSNTGCDFAHHHPRFDVDEEAFGLGVELFLRIVEAYLG